MQINGTKLLFEGFVTEFADTNNDFLQLLCKIMHSNCTIQTKICFFLPQNAAWLFRVAPSTRKKEPVVRMCVERQISR